MKNLKYIIPLFSFLASLLFISCSEEPIILPGEEFDPPRFNWEIDTLNADISGIWAQDSNNVFFADALQYLIYYNGKHYQYFNYGGDVVAYSIDGYDRNNVYIGCLDGVTARPILKKWNGFAFIDIVVSDSANPKTALISTYVNSPNEIWLGASNGHVYKYDGSTFSKFYFDTLMHIGPFLKDASNNMYFVGGIIYENLPNADSAKIFVFKLNLNNWDLVYYKLFNTNTTDTMMSIKNIGNEITGVNYNGIRKFNGSDFNKIINVNGFSLAPRYFGPLISDILCAGTPNGYYSELFHWNGTKWSSKNVMMYYPNSAVYGVNGMYFSTYYEGLFRMTFILKGKPKK